MRHTSITIRVSLCIGMMGFPLSGCSENAEVSNGKSEGLHSVLVSISPIEKFRKCPFVFDGREVYCLDLPKSYFDKNSFISRKIEKSEKDGIISESFGGASCSTPVCLDYQRESWNLAYSPTIHNYVNFRPGIVQYVVKSGSIISFSLFKSENYYYEVEKINIVLEGSGA